MKVSKKLAKQAKQLGICQDWHYELKNQSDKKELISMYLKGIDFCLSNDYPSNDFIRKNFKGVMEGQGVFLDDDIDIVNMPKCVSLGKTKGRIEVNQYSTSEIFVKHESELRIIAKDNSFVMIDIFDDCVVYVHAQGRANVCVNRYGGKLIADPTDPTNGGARIKIIEKHKKTY